MGWRSTWDKLYDRPTRLEDGEKGLRNWITMFGGICLKDVPDTIREEH